MPSTYPSIHSLLPNHEDLLELEPEVLAGVVLEYLNSIPAKDADSKLNRHNFGLSDTAEGYPRKRKDEILRALMEAWVWLEREVLLAPKPASGGLLSVFITRRGKLLVNRIDVEAYRKTNLLPERQLHPVIAQKVWSLFLQGDYDTAIFRAFKEVEVAVRDAGGYDDTDYGVTLMRKAFNIEKGKLTDYDRPVSEREAVLALFAGAIGFYKNPQSHWNVLVEAEEAVEIIIFASHLLRIVTTRKKQLLKPDTL